MHSTTRQKSNSVIPDLFRNPIHRTAFLIRFRHAGRNDKGLRISRLRGLKLWKACVQAVHGTVYKPMVAHNMYALISSPRSLYTETKNPSLTYTPARPVRLSPIITAVLHLLHRTLSPLSTRPITNTTIYL
jgi:hypothetical protein